MICIRSKKHGIKLNTIWLYNGGEVPAADINIFVQALIKPNQECMEFISLYSDLTIDEATLQKQIDRDCRYEIRRAKRDGIVCENFGLNEEISDQMLIEFVNFNNKYAKRNHKGLSTYEELKKIDNFVIFRAILNEDILVYHGYIVGDKQIRQTHTASLYISATLDKKYFLGRAGRLIYENALLTFKDNGYEFFDYAGISDREEIANITRFKKEFGGIEWISYNYSTYNTIKGKLYGKLIRLVKGIGFEKNIDN